MPAGMYVSKLKCIIVLYSDVVSLHLRFKLYPIQALETNQFWIATEGKQKWF